MRLNSQVDVVVYTGDELRGFGNLVLVRHADGWMTAYGHLEKVLAKRGDKVTRGQAIGTVGSSGAVSSPQLHFEIRRATKAVAVTVSQTNGTVRIFQNGEIMLRIEPIHRRPMVWREFEYEPPTGETKI